MHSSARRRLSHCFTLALAAIAACHNDFVPTTPGGSSSFTLSPCSVSGTLTLSVAQTTRVDCSNGGTTVTLAGNGASYLLVAQFPVDLVPNALVPYDVSSGTAIAASRTTFGTGVASARLTAPASSTSPFGLQRPRAKQLAFDHMLRARARRLFKAGSSPLAASRALGASKTAPSSSLQSTVPSVGSVRAFHVLANSLGTAF